MDSKGKKAIVTSVIVMVSFILVLLLEKLTRDFLAIAPEDFMGAKGLRVAARLVLIVASLFVIKKLELIRFTGLNSWKTIKNPQSIIVVAVLLAMGIFQNWNIYNSVTPDVLILFAVATLSVGFAEELIFRGVILPLHIKAFFKSQNPLLIAAVVSNLMFAGVHFLNLFRQPENIVGITKQVFFAVSIGVFFCGLMVRTENVIIPSIIHGLVNFTYGANELKDALGIVQEARDRSVINWGSLVLTTIIFAMIFAAGVYMIKLADKEKILDKLEEA